ncbi:mitochondrial intermediate peptidase, partial [Quercus suber]
PSTHTVAQPPKRGLSTTNRTIMWYLIRRIAPNLRRKPFIGSSNSDPTRTRHYYTSVVAPRQSGASTGLYGFDHLKSPNGFQRFVDEAIERSTELVSYISAMPESSEIIRAMDEISDTVCSVVDSAELCRNTHPDREFVEEANKASMRINEYLHYLNTNHTLYDAVRKAEQENHLLTEEAQRAAHYLRVDFERGGIHLSADKLDRVNQLNIEISQLCREFNENIIIDPGSVDIFPSSRMPKSVHHLLKPIYRSTPGILRETVLPRDTMKEKGFRITTDPQNLSSVLQHVSDDEVRKMAYVQGNSVPVANLGILDKLIATRHELAQEFRKIRDFKREKRGRESGDLEPWDEAYYTALMKSSTYNLDSSVVASYFPLPQCIEGLKVMVESLFGATFHSIPLAPGESWHEDVLKLSLHHPEEGDLGYLYLDLYSRKGKYPGFAHFAIKGGRRISETEYQLPVVALVCNFSGSRNSSTARLNHWELETLFHEFGHALHSLLSRTTFARHYSTGEIIPEKLVKSMQGARKMFAATELQRQIFYALIDQTLFGEQPATPRDTSSIVADLKRKYTSWNHVEGTHWQTRFNHLLNYGAGYYSYLYAKCFAATIWQKLCQEDPLSLTTGTALRTILLQHGGAREPASLLNGLVGEGILRHCNGGIVPDITSLCEEMKLGENI